VRLQVTADRTASKRIGGSRNRGEAGPPADPAGGTDGRLRRDARMWRISGLLRSRGGGPAFMRPRVSPRRRRRGFICPYCSRRSDDDVSGLRRHTHAAPAMTALLGLLPSMHACEGSGRSCRARRKRQSSGAARCEYRL
jgi:hypothetical protein